jgi:uncharacterized protein
MALMMASGRPSEDRDVAHDLPPARPPRQHGAVQASDSVRAALSALVRSLSGVPAVDEVWLFGSRARGDARSGSDIDLAVIAPRATVAEWLHVWDLVDEADTLLPIDLVRLDRAPEKLKAEVTKHGERLYVR